jgi:hypothetical protein
MANVAGDGDREGKKTQGDPVFSAAPPAPLLPSIAGTAANDTPKPITQFSLLCSNCLDVTIIIDRIQVQGSRAGVCTVHVNNNSKSQTPSPTYQHSSRSSLQNGGNLSFNNNSKRQKKS